MSDTETVIAAVVANVVALALFVLLVAFVLKRRSRAGRVTLSIDWRGDNEREREEEQ